MTMAEHMIRPSRWSRPAPVRSKPDAVRFRPSTERGPEGRGNAQGLPLVDGTVKQDMAAFDALPPHLRQIIRGATLNVAAIPLREFWLSEWGDSMDRVMEIALALRQLPQPGTETAETFAPVVHADKT